MPLINITLPEQMKSFMDARHYNPDEIDSLFMGPNTNGEKTYYIDPVNGSDTLYDGLYPDIDGTHGPYKTIAKAMGGYDGHRYGERILLKSGTYTRNFIGWANLLGLNDNDHWNSIGPYGDGEVVLDFSHTCDVNDFVSFSGNIWQGSFKSTFPNYPSCNPGWCVMDYVYNLCKKAVGYQSSDNSGVNNKTTTMTDTTKNFVSVPIDDGIHYGTLTTDFVGAIIWNKTTGAWGIVTSISTTTNTNDTLNFSGGLQGGTRNTFDNSDQYAVYIMNEDGRWCTVGLNFYIVSTNGNPKTSRHIIINQNDNDSADTLYYNTSPRVYVYGLTMIGAPSYFIYNLFAVAVKTEKCRLLFCGKGAWSNYGGSPTYQLLKNFVYAPVMLNWPRGNTYGGNGGWPDGVGAYSLIGSYLTGNIIWQSGGEGTNSFTYMQDNIIYDAFSMTYYMDSASGLTVERNVAIFSGYKPNDIQDFFYLKNHYNGIQRTYVKMHPNGITPGVEQGTPHPPGSASGVIIRNNIVIGCWNGINGYFEVSGFGFQHVNIMNNTIICMTDEDGTAGAAWVGNGNMSDCFWLYGDSQGLGLNCSSPDNYDTIIKNNIVIGANYSDGRHHVITIWGSTYSNFVVNNNFYSFLGNNNFATSNGIKTFSQWQTLTGYDANSLYTDTPNLEGVDWSDSSTILKSHLRLLSSSFAVNAGADLSVYLTDDFNQLSRPQGAAYDIGAIEYTDPTEKYAKEALNSLPATDADLTTEFYPMDYVYAGSNDGDFTLVTAPNKYGVFLMKDKNSSITNIPVRWIGKTNIPGSQSTLYLQIYNRNSTTWETIASNNTCAAEEIVTLYAEVTTNLSNYYDANYWVACRVYQQAI